MKKHNRFVLFDIIGIIFFIILFINDLFICTNAFSMNYFESILMENSIIYYVVFFSILIFCGLFILGNLFIIIIKDKNIKTILLRVCCIILLVYVIYKTIWIFQYGYIRSFHVYYNFLLISGTKIILMILSIIGIYYEKNLDIRSRIFNFYFIAILILFIAFLVLYLIFIITFKISNDKVSDFIYKINNRVLNNEFLIPVKKNGKWGCINKKGKLIVDYTYDDIYNIANSNYHSKYLLAQKDNDYYYIDNDGNVVVEFHNDFLPIKSDAYFSPLWENKLETKAQIASSFITSYADNTFVKVEDDENNSLIINYEYNDNFEKIYYIDLNDGYRIELMDSSIKHDYGNWFDITYKLNNKIIFNVEDVKLSLTLIKDNLKYNDYNDITFTNQNDLYGYINIINHEYSLLKGNASNINTTKDMYYYFDNNEDYEYFKEKESNTILGIYYMIYGESNKGFIVENKSGKFSFLDLELHEYFINSDDISELYMYDDLYVCKKDNSCFVFNSKGERISNDDYQDVKGTINKL